MNVQIASELFTLTCFVLGEFHLDKNFKRKKKKRVKENLTFVLHTHITAPGLTLTSDVLPSGAHLGPILGAGAPNRLMGQITVKLALDPTSEAHPLKFHD